MDNEKKLHASLSKGKEETIKPSLFGTITGKTKNGFLFEVNGQKGQLNSAVTSLKIGQKFPLELFNNPTEIQANNNGNVKCYKDENGSIICNDETEVDDIDQLELRAGID